MGGNGIEGPRAVLIAVGDPSRTGEIVAFLRGLDYDASLVDTGNLEASPPEAWPDGLGLAALERFLAVWQRANPDVEVRIENVGSFAE